jgi:hypothetical protein
MYGRHIVTLSLAVALTCAALPANAQTASPWIHVEVIEQNEKASTVNVNLPLSMAEVALEVAPDKLVKKGKIKLPNNDISIADLRKLWNELRNAGDAQFVTVKEKDQDVSIARRGDKIEIRVQEAASAEKDKKASNVHVDLPVSVVDALLSGEGEELNFKNAIAQLRTQRGDIVRVRDGESNVRIWIDERSSRQ